MDPLNSTDWSSGIRNSRGYKLHLDVADAQTPIAAFERSKRTRLTMSSPADDNRYRTGNLPVRRVPLD